MNEIAIRDINELNSVACTVAKSGLFGAKSPEQAYVAIATGMELGLKPMQALRNIVVIQGKPTFSADGAFAVVRNHPEYGGIEWIKQDAQEASCKITRVSKGGQLKETFVGSFSMKEAAAAGLANKDNWKHYPARMLRARALSFACRDAFPDVLNGLYTPEEIREVTEVQQEPQEREIKAEVVGYPTENAAPVEQTEAQPAVDAAPAEQQEEPKMKGGNATKAETDKIRRLLLSKYEDGTRVFSNEEIELYSSYRYEDSPEPGPMTAGELIKFITGALANRTGADEQEVQ